MKESVRKPETFLPLRVCVREKDSGDEYEVGRIGGEGERGRGRGDWRGEEGGERERREERHSRHLTMGRLIRE